MAVDPVSASLAGASLVSGLLGSRSAKKAAIKAAERQSVFTGIQRDEELRKLRRQSDVDVGMARAAVGASNVRFSGSSDAFIDELRSEYDKQLAFGRMAKTAEQRAIMAGASGAGNAQLIQGVGQAVSFGIKAAAPLFGDNDD